MFCYHAAIKMRCLEQRLHAVVLESNQLTTVSALYEKVLNLWLN